MGKKLLLLGGGGHCCSVLDSIMAIGVYTELAIVAPDDHLIPPIDRIGTDEDLPALYEQGWKEIFVAVGSVGKPTLRHKLYEMIREIGMTSPVIVDPTGIVGENVVIGKGSFVGKRAVINTACTIGECTIVNSGAIVEHGCEIGDFVHISPGAVLCGEVKVGNDVHIGAGAVLKQGVHIGDGTVIGMGSVVLSDIPSNVIAYGNPCKVQREAN